MASLAHTTELTNMLRQPMPAHSMYKQVPEFPACQCQGKGIQEKRRPMKANVEKTYEGGAILAARVGKSYEGGRGIERGYLGDTEEQMGEGTERRAPVLRAEPLLSACRRLRASPYFQVSRHAGNSVLHWKDEGHIHQGCVARLGNGKWTDKSREQVKVRLWKCTYRQKRQ